ncbi:MAG TPA: hypothetical protein VIW29_08285 [Polyangiaceae bacterium]
MARLVYPLHALRALRDERAQAQQRQLAEHVTRTQQALAALARREQLRREHAARTARELQVERQRLLLVPSSGADLARLAEFEAALRAQAALLERAEAEAREKLASERAEEQRARAALSQREADAKLVREHEAGFQARADEAASRAEEEAMLEQWNARRQ